MRFMAWLARCSALMDRSSFCTVMSSFVQNRVQIQGDGILSYTQTPVSADGRLTGRFTINNGFVRYSLPVICVLQSDA